MKAPRFFACLCVAVLSSAATSPALAFADLVFVSARSGTDANACDNVNTPCRTFARAVTQLKPNGEVIVLDSGDYGPVTITRSVTIEAPAGVTAFIHPPAGDAITVNALGGLVTLRGLTLNFGTNGIIVNSVAVLNVEDCFIMGFLEAGIQMFAGERLNLKGTVIRVCGVGVLLSGIHASIDHCQLDGNNTGFLAATMAPGISSTKATYTTADNGAHGWICGSGTSGTDVLNLEFCSGSENSFDGLAGYSTNARSVVRYSNCVFANNVGYGVARYDAGVFETRGNNTITGNGAAPTFGRIGSFSPM